MTFQMIDERHCISHAVLKVASRCNLNCSYCYVYNMADSTWKMRPPLMSNEVFEAALERVYQQCRASGQKRFKLAFHGGEPCLLGARTFDAWCEKAHAKLDHIVDLSFVMQTNGSLLDSQWIEVLRKHRVGVGISMDGPKEIHDAVRVDHRQQGSYDRVARGLRLLQEGGVSYGIGCVIPSRSRPAHRSSSFPRSRLPADHLSHAARHPRHHCPDSRKIWRNALRRFPDPDLRPLVV